MSDQVFWFEIVGKIHASSREAADELLYRYGLAAYPEMKIKEINLEGDSEQ
jgi:hypothetical protein